MRMKPPVLDAITEYATKYPESSRPTAYIASPIFGISPEEQAQSFAAGRTLAMRSGYVAVLPPEIEPREHNGPCPRGRQNPGALHSEACHLRADLKVLLECDALILMPHWTSSWGSKMELQVASAAGLVIYVAELDYRAFPDAARIGRLLPV